MHNILLLIMLFTQRCTADVHNQRKKSIHKLSEGALAPLRNSTQSQEAWKVKMRVFSHRQCINLLQMSGWSGDTEDKLFVTSRCFLIIESLSAKPYVRIENINNEFFFWELTKLSTNQRIITGLVEKKKSFNNSWQLSWEKNELLRTGLVTSPDM